MASKTNNIQYMDTLRALAILGVIIIHISSPLVNMTYGKNMPYWWIGNIIDSGVRFAVPLFLMLSGATMLGKNYKTIEYYQKRLVRVFVPFLFWIVLYFIFRWSSLLSKQQPHEFYSTVNWAVDLFLKEGVSKHFWYIYMILSIYLFVPFMGKRLRKLNLPIISNILLLWVILTFVCRSLPLNMYSWTGDYQSKLLGYFLYSGYLVLGYYLSRLPSISQKVRFSAAAIFILTVAISAICTSFFSKGSNKPDLTMYSYLSVNTIIQSVAIFIVLKDLNIKNKYIYRTQNTISNYSYGIYLVHVMVIGILFQNGVYWSFAYPLISIPLLTLMVLSCSYGIIYLLRKIPFGKYVAG
jgi:surface polysaccharide O-acyltransferase-like enzyme